jgi:hypothetical protein
VGARSDYRLTSFFGPTAMAWCIRDQHRVGGPQGGLWQRGGEEGQCLGFWLKNHANENGEGPIYKAFTIQTCAARIHHQFYL